MSMALAVGSPGAETPYSVSIPITRRALMPRAYEAPPTRRGAHPARPREGGRMEYRTLGGSGCSVSTYALGTMTFGAESDEAGAFAQLDAFVEAGGTFVDVADVYAGGTSEEILGRWLAGRPTHLPGRGVVATKGRVP